ncbi:MAG: hypothetical protein H7Y42_02935 [Chitinophagaceae bacterium]|nr:hypothetical protein [Chitinophagaceae bacterium]
MIPKIIKKPWFSCVYSLLTMVFDGILTSGKEEPETERERGLPLPPALFLALGMHFLQKGRIDKILIFSKNAFYLLLQLFESKRWL